MPSNLSTVMENIATVIEGSATFIAKCAIDSVDPADQIYWFSARPGEETEAVRPAVIARPLVILRPEKFELLRYSAGCMQPDLTVRMHINDKWRGADWQAQVKDFLEFYSALVEDIASINESGTSTPIRSISQVNDPVATERREGTPNFGFWAVEFDLLVGNEFD